ncbi:isopeptide-forming domain-containing fimbrial protein [Bacillus pfraonensis]|uniref:SpaA isopeptide-forming pilin-related protein n=1 Tax=Bacillus TaxID=1386 RepID=UPI003012EC95
MKNKQISIFVICLMLMQIIAQPFIHMVEAATYDKEANVSLKLSVEGGDGSQKDVDKDFVYQLDLSTFGLEGGHKDAKIIVKLPPEVEYVRHGKISGTDAIYDKETHSVIYTFKDFLPNGDSKAVPITVKFPKGTKDGTTATAVADFVSDQGGKTSNNVTVVAHEKEVPPEPPKKPEWNIGKTPNKWTIKPGEEVEYTIRAKHVSGPTTLDSLSIKDLLPKEAQFISASDNGKYDANSHTVTWDLKNVEGEKAVTVKVKFPEENFGENQSKSIPNRVEAKLKPKGEEELTKQTHAYVTVSNKETKPPVIPPDQAFSNLVKAAQKPEYSKNEEIAFTLYNIKNQYSKEIDNFVLQDDRFDEQLRFTRMHTGVFLGVSEYKLLYKTKNNPEWKEWKVIRNNRGEWLDVSSLSLAEGDKVTGIRYEFGKVPANFAISSGVWLYFKVDDPNFKEGILKNTAHISYDIDGKQYQKDATAQVTVKENPESKVTFKKKALTKPGEKYIKGDIVEFELTGNADWQSAPFKQPIIVDWLPKGLEYVPGSEQYTLAKGGWDKKSYDAAKVKVETIANYKEKGRTLLRWNFPELDMSSGDAITVKFKVKVNNFAMAGKYYNKAGLMSNVSKIKSANEWQQKTLKDENDLDGDGDVTDPIIESEDAIEIEEEQSLKSIKYVKGELDKDWKGLPEVATTVPGGEVKYRLKIENGGTVAVRNGVLIDIFPAEGDQSVLQTKNHVQERGSKWTPYLTSPIQLTEGDFIKIYYTTASNPKRDDLIQDNDVFVNPKGANDPNWSLEPPSDLTKVTAVKFEFDKNKLVYPGEEAILEWSMRAPVDIDDSTGIAWNSFGYSAINDVTGKWIQPAEPNRVGVQLKASKKSSLGDYVWLDKNKDGIQNDGNTGMNGVVVELLDKDGKVISMTRTGNDKKGNPGYYKFVNLDPGEYQVRFKMPDGYKWTQKNAGNDEKSDSNVDKDGYSEIIKLGEDEHNMTIDAGLVEDTVDAGELEVTKVEKGSNNPLEGAVFEVRGKGDQVIQTITSGEDGKARATDLPIGEYKLVEVTAPEGYKLDGKSYDFEITKDTKTPIEITVENELLEKGVIELTKVDAKNVNLKLKNAVFQILDKDGKEVGKLTTDENGKAISDQLVFGKYTIKEIQAPDGYMLLRDPIEIEVRSSVQKITIENTKSEWVIPDTGGIGTTIFYLLGTILMVITVFLFFCKRSSN